MRWLRYWLPVILWAGAISGLSTGHFSAEKTAVVFLPVLRWLLPHASAETLDQLHSLIRKGGHVSEYFVFGLLALRAIRRDRSQWRWSWALEALALGGALGLLDEFHQWFVPGRTADLSDSLLDTSSVAASLLVAWAAIKFTSSEKRRPETPEAPRHLRDSEP